MVCYNTDRRLHELQRCGCRQCEREFYRLRDELRYNERYDMRAVDYFPPKLVMQNAVLATAVDYIKDKPVEEIKNCAVKLLVDKLKNEQTTLKSNQSSINHHQAELKKYNAVKQNAQKNIKDLSVALKKLGHKDA